MRHYLIAFRAHRSRKMRRQGRKTAGRGYGVRPLESQWEIGGKGPSQIAKQSLA
jgi:hypothetical protein